MTAVASTIASIDVDDYQREILHHLANRPADYTPATAREPRRVLTRRGAVLAASRNGEGIGRWGSHSMFDSSRLLAHVAVTGQGYAYGTSVAACNGSVELGEDADPNCFVDARGLDMNRRCQRPGCRALWPLADTLLPAGRVGDKTTPPEGDQVT